MASVGSIPSEFKVRIAQESDLLAILKVVNQAFVVERFFLEHDRTSLENLSELLRNGTFLIAEDAQRRLVGSVYVELRGDRAYFGMLSVDPARQGTGLGKLLVAAAEDYARQHGCTAMDITVVNLRTELPLFYGKLGYQEVGTAPLHDGMRVTQPAHLIKMSKSL